MLYLWVLLPWCWLAVGSFHFLITQDGGEMRLWGLWTGSCVQDFWNDYFRCVCDIIPVGSKTASHRTTWTFPTNREWITSHVLRRTRASCPSGATWIPQHTLVTWQEEAVNRKRRRRWTRRNERAGCRSGKALNRKLGDARFESRSGNRLSWMRLPNSLILPRFGRYQPFPYPFQFIVDVSSLCKRQEQEFEEK